MNSIATFLWTCFALSFLVNVGICILLISRSSTLNNILRIEEYIANNVPERHLGLRRYEFRKKNEKQLKLFFTDAHIRDYTIQLIELQVTRMSRYLSIQLIVFAILNFIITIGFLSYAILFAT